MRGASTLRLETLCRASSREASSSPPWSTQHPTPSGHPTPNGRPPNTHPTPNAQKRTSTDRYANVRGASGRRTEVPRKVSRPETSSSPPVEASDALQANVTKQRGPPRGDPAVTPEEQTSTPATRASATRTSLPPRPGVTLPSAWNRKRKADARSARLLIKSGSPSRRGPVIGPLTDGGVINKSR